MFPFVYDLSFVVQYATIEQELMAKWTDTSSNLEYTDTDIQDICDALYRAELLNVFGCTTWEELQDKEYIHEACFWIRTNHPERTCPITEENKDSYLIEDIITLFDYEHFHQTHAWLQSMS